MNRLLLFAFGVVALFIAILLPLFLSAPPAAPEQPSVGQEAATTQNPGAQTAAVVSATLATTTFAGPASATSAPTPGQGSMRPVQTEPATRTSKTVSHPIVQPAQPAADQVQRIQDPYAFPPESFDVVNAQARSALVNILCMPRGGGSIDPISASGVIIDPRGVILTNAHVAQYVLLSQDPRVDLSCAIRTGAPARSQYSAETLYMPPTWVFEHANEINELHPTGTGAHDYGLLLINGMSNGDPLQAPSGGFPYLPVDTREAIAFQGDQVLVASYPAEFLGGIEAQIDLYPASSVTTIGQLITFDKDTVDLLSLGGIIEAQSGSSGGAVANAWGRLVGLVVTTSAGTTTAQRDLRALSLSYIDRDLQSQSGLSLSGMLSGDVAAEARQFDAETAPGLIETYIPLLKP